MVKKFVLGQIASHENRKWKPKKALFSEILGETPGRSGLGTTLKKFQALLAVVESSAQRSLIFFSILFHEYKVMMDPVEENFQKNAVRMFEFEE